MVNHARIAIFAALFASVSTGCGGGATTHASAPQPAAVATAAEGATSDGSGLDASAVRRLPRGVDHVMRVHLGPLRGTAFEDVALARLPLNPAGADRDLQIDILAHTEVLTIGLAEEAAGWVFEGELGQRFDAVVERFTATTTPTVSGPPGRRTVGDARVVVGEVGNVALTIHTPASAAADTGDVPSAVASQELRELGAALPPMPAGRTIVFQAWLAPTWGLFRELPLVARITYGGDSNDLHIDAALRYPDAETAAARASGWGEFWDGVVQERPESFDRERASVRRDGAELVLHHELRGLFDEPAANERLILWTLFSLAAHQPRMNLH